MKVMYLVPGMQFKSPMWLDEFRDTDGLITFIQYAPHPLYGGLALVIWKMPDGSWSHDALSWNQEITQELQEFTAEMLINNLRKALHAGGK